MNKPLLHWYFLTVDGTSVKYGKWCGLDLAIRCDQWNMRERYNILTQVGFQLTDVKDRMDVVFSGN